MTKVTITKGSSQCDECGWYEWHTVVCQSIGYSQSYNGHLSGGPSIEECLIEILTKLGASVEIINID